MISSGGVGMWSKLTKAPGSRLTDDLSMGTPAQIIFVVEHRNSPQYLSIVVSPVLNIYRYQNEKSKRLITLPIALVQ